MAEKDVCVIQTTRGGGEPATRFHVAELAFADEIDEFDPAALVARLDAADDPRILASGLESPRAVREWLAANGCHAAVRMNAFGF